MKTNNAYHQLQSRLGYEFNDAKLLKRALTHRSFGSPNNERLEFLGDSVLGAVIGHCLFAKFPNIAEGQLTRLRASLVKGDTLAQVAGELDIGPSLIMGEGEVKSGGRERESILADAVESLIGAVYLESGFDACAQVVLPWFESRLANIEIDKPLKDPKTELQELLQARGESLPEYTIAKVEGQAHNQMITVSAQVAGIDSPIVATAKNRKKAEKKAAAQAIKIIKGAK